MSGLLSLSEYKSINPETESSDTQITFALRVAQGIAERLSGLRFGSEVTAFEDDPGGKKITYDGSDIFNVGDYVKMLAPVPSDDPAPTEIAPVVEAGNGYIIVNVSCTDCAVGKILPVISYEGTASSNKVYCHPKPVFTIESVKVKASSETLWQDTSGVTTVPTTSYEIFEENQLKTGVRLKSSVIPYVADGGEYLVKRLVAQPRSSILLTYSAGFHIHVPVDLQAAASELVVGILGGMQKGLFASENLDYYSYSQMSSEQMASLPYSAVATFRHYGRF